MMGNHGSGESEEVEELRACFAACLDTSSYGTLVCGRGGSVLASNQRLREWFGLHRGRVVGKAADRVLEQIGAQFASPVAFRRRIETARAEVASERGLAPQSLQSWLAEALPLSGDGSRVISITCAGIWQDDQALGEVWSFEDASQVSRDDALLHTLGEASATAFVITRISDAQIIYANAEMGRLLGCSADALIGTRSYAMYDNPEDRNAYVQQLVRHGSVRSHEVKMRRRDGTAFWSLLSMNKLDLGGDAVAIGSLYDITARKQAEERQQVALRELKETQAMLVTSEKMAALGSLVAGIAHEINTPIGAMASMHDTLVRAFKRLEPTLHAAGTDPSNEMLIRTIQDCNRVIKQGAERVADIVRRLRSFARLDKAELQEANLEEGLDDTLALLQNEFKHRIDLTRDYGGVRPISCHAGRLNQVFLNLLVNAHQAIEGNGAITVRTRELDGAISVEIIDDGCGIPEENLSRLFDPGFTTKGVGVGTGLGLSICYQIVHEHGGDLLVESTLGQGTTMKILIPLRTDAGTSPQLAR